jgi:hypothetical protein
MKKVQSQENDYIFSDDEDDKDDFSKHMNFVMKFGTYRGGKLGEIVKIKKGRDALRYYLGWENLRNEARVSIATVLADYEDSKARFSAH